MDQRLEGDVIDVLSRASTQGCALRLPPEQLDRKLYERVNKALTNAGGKWMKGIGHVFPSAVAPKLAAMLGTGVSVDEKKRDQAFFTPLDLARQMVAVADVRGKVVLEPEAGKAALAHECRRQGAQEIICYELNSEYVAYLRKFYRVFNGDFLDAEPFVIFERVVMNPPFTKNQDIAHVKHALKWLQPNGILVSLMTPNRNRKGFQEIVDEYDPEIIEVERGAFKESGTSIATIIVKIKT